ncbi:hypothetical protein EUX98_g4264 [Antrodiella citrinella]|uniref:Beta-xylanase n=1 Tax=Antrodiella citrinella TaxID=2447956 RepID=A0A4S4MUK4_9APHY|nr:hypothetical protein EUX98_g4264 [Antrodiella citrinella]
MIFASLLSLASLVKTAVALAVVSPRAGQELHTLAKAKGKLYFGTATDNPELTDTPYVAILDDHNMFGQITAANSMKWASVDATEPNQGDFTFAAGDVIANLAKSNGQLLREIFNDDGTIREDVFSQTTGMDFIATAFRAARAADPNAKLYANDFNIEGPGVKATAYQNLIKTLQSQGVPIDGIGMQSHFIVGELPANIQENIEAFVALGVEVAITELDVRMTLPSTPALLAQQQTDYQTVITACANVPKCVGVTLWDFTDKFSWVPGTFAGQGAACPWDDNLVEKPAFQGIVSGFS